MERRALNHKVRVIASRFYISAIKCKAGVTSLHQIPQHIRTQFGNDPYASWLEEKLRPLYKNVRGAKINKTQSKELIESLERFFPGTRQNLDLPLWALMMERSPTQRKLNDTLGETKIAGLFKTDDTREDFPDEKQILRIGQLNTLDALTCLLALLQESKLKWSHPCSWTRSEAFQLFFRLAIFQPVRDVAFEMFSILNKNFFDYTYPHGVLYLPFFHGLENSDNFNFCLQEHDRILKLALELKLVDNNEREKLSFLYCIDVGPKVEIIRALNKIQNTGAATPQEYSLLSKLKRKTKSAPKRNIYLWTCTED